MDRIERALIIIFGIIISAIVSIGVLMLLPFPYGLVVGISFPIILMYAIFKIVKLDSKPQNDDIQKLKDRVEELEKDKEKKE